MFEFHSGILIALVLCLNENLLSNSVQFYLSDCVKIRLLVELLIPEFDCAPSLSRPCSFVSVLERKAQVGKSGAPLHTCRGCCGSILY